MSVNWGPHFIVPSETIKTFSGRAQLRETFDEALLNKELEALGLASGAIQATNPWYYRKKGTETWVKIGESDDRKGNFAVPWDTTRLENGDYEILGLMHVNVKSRDSETTLARQNIVEITIRN